VRKRSRSTQGTDEERAIEPASGESGSEAPGRTESEKASEPQRTAGSRRRAPRKGSTRDSAQGKLFDETTTHNPPRAEAQEGAPPGKGDSAPQDDSSPQGEVARDRQAEAKKSRSKRRRERRKAAKAAGSSSLQKPDAPRPQIQAAKVPEAPAAARADAPASQSRDGGQARRGRQQGPAQSREGQRRDSQNRDGQRRDSPRRSDERRTYGQQSAGRGQGRQGPRPEGGYRERRGPETQRARPRARPDGLPPLSAEDLAAVSQTGYDDGAIPRYVTNTARGASRARAPLMSAPSAVHRLETLSPSSASIAALAALEGVLDEAVPLQAKHRAELRGDIRKLWEELTSDRESRNADYLGTPPALSAYLRYFLPWNVYRLASILTNADFCLPDKAVIVDIGSGPLTLPIALWVARPELRDVPLTIYCVDRVERVLDAGKNIFETLCMRVDGRLPPWRIETRKDSFGSPMPEKAHLLTAANVFNEFFWKDKQKNLGEKALDTAHSLLSYIKENGSIFVMEPGDPRSGAFITALRAALLAEGAGPLGPCPHALSCPMPGIFRHLLPPEETRTVKNDPNVAPSRFVLPQVIMPKKRDKFPWCHFGINALQAPAWLEKLSEEAGLPKERAVLSYLWAARGVTARPPVGMPESSTGRGSDRDRRGKAGRGVLVRVVSDPFALPDGSTGQYACSSLGYTLLRRPRGEESFASGDLLEVTSSGAQRNDEKSGAIILST
jgi:hypothetical protein